MRKGGQYASLAGPSKLNGLRHTGSDCIFSAMVTLPSSHLDSLQTINSRLLGAMHYHWQQMDAAQAMQLLHLTCLKPSRVADET